jgi:ubiquinone/menaquinone biosynthesis C-methylase UbiE
VEQQKSKNVAVLFNNASHLSFPSDTFDRALSGFMGWYDCFDFERNEFTQPDTKAAEIHRVLRNAGRFVCCSWEAQEDLAWMEEAILRHYPEMLTDDEYLERRPIGMAYEKPEGYELILRGAGFDDIRVSREAVECVSTDEQEWWQQMSNVGWDTLLAKIESKDAGKLNWIKEAIIKELQPFKHSDGIHFTKQVFFISGVK